MRTDEEVVARIREIKREDVFGFEAPDLIGVLPLAMAKEWLRDGVTETDWSPLPRDADSVRTRMREYLPFALDKARCERGISASRSVSHYRAWAWLLGDDELLAFVSDEANYAPYGMPILLHIAKVLGVDPEAPFDEVHGLIQEIKGLRAKD